MSDSKILQQVTRYTEVIGDALTLLERIALFLRGLSDPEVRARRFRHQAARLLGRAQRAVRSGHFERAINLSNRAQRKWIDAQDLDPVDAEIAARGDLQAGNV